MLKNPTTATDENTLIVRAERGPADTTRRGAATYTTSASRPRAQRVRIDPKRKRAEYVARLEF
jgi:hypothetical protein